MDGDVPELVIDASPNPASSFFTVEWQSNLSGPVTIEMYNLVGTKIYSITDATSGSIQLGNELTAGMYFIHIKQGSEEKIIKVIKQN